MSNWATSWSAVLALPEATPEWAIALISFAVIYSFVILPNQAIMIFIQRKLVADIQARVGPNQAGPSGLFQPFADLLKILQRSDSSVLEKRQKVWGFLYVMALFSSVSVLPLASNGLMVDTDGSVFIPFISITLSLLVTFLMGINQHSVSGYFGGIRIGAQAISAAFPALISILCAGVRGHGFRWSGISAAQGAWPYQWSAFLSPFEFISFLVFIASGIVMLSNNPAEAGFQTKDIHGGMHAAQTVGRDPAFRLGRVYSVFLWNVMAAVLFLGGWRLPDTVHNFFTETQSPGLLLITETLLVVIKADVLIILTALLCSVSPKIRSDQATDFTWKILSPLNLLCLSGAAIWMSFLAAA